jgi:cell division protein FtsB
MKIGKVTWIIIGVVVFCAALGVLYMLYAGQKTEQDSLRVKLETNQAMLPKLVADRQDWESQLAALQDQLAQRQSELVVANAALAEAQTGWPTAAESIEYDETLFSIADGWHLQIQSLVAGEKQSRAVQGIDFGTTSFTVVVSSPGIKATESTEYQDKVYGVINDILSYIDSLAQQKEFATATIDTISMTVPPAMTREELDSSGGVGPAPTATITITIYTYKGG